MVCVCKQEMGVFLGMDGGHGDKGRIWGPQDWGPLLQQQGLLEADPVVTELMHIISVSCQVVWTETREPGSPEC